MRRGIVYGLILSMLAAYPLAYKLLPASIVLPGRPVEVQGLVVTKNIGQDGYVSLPTSIWYTLSIRLTSPDPLNKVLLGNTFAYGVSKADFDKVNEGDHVKATVWSLHAHIVTVTK